MGERPPAGLAPTTILRDTREKRPWRFEGYGVETQEATLATGDYTLPIGCEYDSETDTYSPLFAVERKSGPDFLQSLTWERTRFKAELQRAGEWQQPLAVVVETSWETLCRNRGCMARRDVHPSQVVGTLSAWTRQYNVTFHFTATRLQAELCAFMLLVRYNLLQRLE